jgi:extracellular elastinolytic metalloproteinase
MARSRRGTVVAVTMAAVTLLIPTMAAAAAKDPVDVAIRHVQDNARDLGVARSDVSDLVVSSSYRSAHNRVTHVNLTQRRSGLEVFGGHVTVNVAADGSVVFAGGSLVPGVGATSGSARTDAIAAVEAAADALELGDPGRLRVLSERAGPARRTEVSGGAISDRAIPARLGYQPAPGGLRLAWQLVIDDSSDAHMWNATVDAETGDLLAVDDWTDHDTRQGLASGLQRSGAETAAASPSPGATVFGSANPVLDGSSYRVYPQESPDDGDRMLLSNPADGLASPFGWHDVSGTTGADFTITRGNNVHAYTDRDASNDADPGSEPDGGPGLDFDSPIDLGEQPQTYVGASLTNLFYWCNITHDLLHLYGFDEASGNFQVNNYGRGGAGGDDVRCESMDGSFQSNANFNTPAVDGGRPRMQTAIEFGSGLPSAVTVASGPAAGTYLAQYARFSPAATTAGTPGTLVLVDDGNGAPNDGCDPYTLPPGSIAVVDTTATCDNYTQAKNAEAAGAVSVVVVHTANTPALMSGSMVSPVGIPAVRIGLADGNAIKAAIAGSPAPGSVHRNTARPPMRVGDLDTATVLHEYGHGLSNRLTGGPGINCLSGQEQMGEGWSDFVALVALIDTGLDDPDGVRGIFPYVVFEPPRIGPGLRPRPYSRNMSIQPFTYDRIKTGSWITGGSLSAPHGIGHGWAAVLWDMTWNLIDRHGFNPNLYAPWNTGGNNLALQLVVDGLKIQGCAPGFVVGRDAIIAADQALSGGENACIIWSSFARRGLGFSATQGTSADRNDNTEAFDVPASCKAPGNGFASPPVANPPAVNSKDAGRTIPLKFHIGGDRGRDPLASNSPASQQIDCTTLKPTQFAVTTPVETDGFLRFNRAQQRYDLNWATQEDWAGTCRRVVITLDDGKQLTANFRFT